jgi:hypothetical protein
MVGKLAIPLVAGLNLASVPLLVPRGDPAVPFGGTPVEGAWAYDAWTRGWPSWSYARSANSLRLAPGTGLWVRSSSAGSLAVVGRVAGTVQISLQEGWNLMGIPRLSGPLTVADLSLAVDVLGFDPSAPPGYTRRLAAAEPLPGGSAVWVRLLSSTTIFIRP